MFERFYGRIAPFGSSLSWGKATKDVRAVFSPCRATATEAQLADDRRAFGQRGTPLFQPFITVAPTAQRVAVAFVSTDSAYQEQLLFPADGTARRIAQ